MQAWGWRVPFLLGLAVGAVGAYMRWQLGDTPSYTEVERRGAVLRRPLAEAVTLYRKPTMLAAGITVHNTVAYYAVLIYMTSWLSTAVKLPRGTALWIGTTCLAIFVVLIPLVGAWSDRIGRRPPLIASCIGYVLLAWPMFALAATGSAALAFAELG